MSFSLSGKTNELRPLRSLINLLRDDSEKESKFVLFLGAGASKTSGVPTARNMIDEWRKDYSLIEKDGLASGVEVLPLEKQSWYESSEEYSRLFESIYHKPAQRRNFIEKSLSGASPSWGYIYLTNLIKQGVFNTVFTTNFDDLLNEACYLYSDSTRPIVCAHDSSIRYVRITSSRPKIIKLHGDFLFDNIKNTYSEIESLEKNMKEKFGQYASEFGFIFLGYSGNDKSVMEVLSTLRRQDGSFPHGIYWCVRSESEISDRLRDLASDGSIEFVKITGFDEFCAELHEGLGLQQQEQLSDPYGCLSRRLDDLISSARIPDDDAHPIIHRDLANLAKKIRDIFPGGVRPVDPHISNHEGDNDVDVAPVEVTKSRKIAIPKLFLAKADLYAQRYENALNQSVKIIEKDPTFDSLDVAIRSLAHSWSDVVAKKILDATIDFLVENPDDLNQLQFAMLDLMRKGHAQFVVDFCEAMDELGINSKKDDFEYYMINWGQAYCHVSRDLPTELREKLEIIGAESNSASSRFGALIVLQKITDAIEVAPAVMEEGIHSGKEILSWPITKLIPEGQRADLAERLRITD